MSPLLRPDYADAYTNMAIVEIPGSATTTPSPISPRRSRCFPATRAPSTTAPSSSATPARAKPPSPTSRPCSPQYPRSKDGLRELGFCYFQAARLRQPRATQYERLQAIDPDDLAAHYSLAIIYRRLGEKEKSAIESAKFADQKDDPTASVYALEFLGKHPEVAAESVVWHTHDLTGDPVKRPDQIEYHYIPGAGF